MQTTHDIGLTGKTFVITGASSGLGKALAIALAAHNVNLVLAARNQEALNEVAQICGQSGSPLPLTVRTDVTDADQCRAMVEQAVKQYGSIDYLILNAGISMWSLFENVTDVSIFNKIINVNYLGAVHCIHSALPHLKKNRGTIVAISSIQGKMGMPFHSGYAASKHALHGFLDSLRMELNDVHILTVMPHWISGTSLRENALGTDGQKIGLSKRRHSNESISLDMCSQAIIKAMIRGKSEVAIPFKLNFVPWLKLIAPGILRNLVLRKIRSQDP